MELLQIRTESEQDSLTTGPPLVGEMVGRGLCGLVTLSLSIYIYILQHAPECSFRHWVRHALYERRLRPITFYTGAPRGRCSRAQAALVGTVASRVTPAWGFMAWMRAGWSPASSR